jgi:hypothetical protein
VTPDGIRELAEPLLSQLARNVADSGTASALAVRSLELLESHVSGLTGQEKAGIWGTLARAIHARFTGWNAAGPYGIAGGSFAYWGGIPAGYVIVFRADGRVFLGKHDGQPGSRWMPDYQSLETLEHYVQRHRRSNP